MGHRGAVVLSPMFTLDESKQLSGEIEKTDLLRSEVRLNVYEFIYEMWRKNEENDW